MHEVGLSSSYFELFDLPETFDIDLKALTSRYRELQRTVHPDRYANASEAEQRLSVQMAARINEGFRTLKDPLARARYLLEQQGMELDDSQTRLDNTFLMEQMELRERIDGVKTASDTKQALSALAADVSQRESRLVAELTTLFTQGNANALAQAREVSRKLQFFRRLQVELAELEDMMVDS